MSLKISISLFPLYFSLLIFSSLLSILNSQIIGIDLGSEFFKVSITLPHQNKYYMVENLQSKIKTNTAIFLRNTDRIYESEVLIKKLKNPKNSFTFLSKYLGSTKNSNKIENYFQKYFYNYDYTFDNETSAINFKVKFVNEEENIVETNFPLEALYGMLFRYIKKISEKYYLDNFVKNEQDKMNINKNKNIIEYCSLTVPSYYTYKQRLAITFSVYLTDMTLLGIVNDNTAAAFYYFKRNFDINNYNKEPKDNKDNKENKQIYFIYINIGSSNTQITLVAYDKEYMHVIEDVSDSDLGGHVFTRNLVYKICQIIGIDEKNLDINLYNKLYQYASKFKETLSANKEVHMNFALDNKNYKGVLTRDDFNEVNKKEFEKIPKLLDELFLKANKTLKDISQFELIGGSIRIPEIQNVIRDYIGEENNDLIGTHLNGDDSVAIGAAYSIRWRKKILETIPYNISMEIISAENETIIKNRSVIFDTKTLYDERNMVEIVYDKNLKVDVYEKDVKLFRCDFNTVTKEIKKYIKTMNKYKNSTFTKIPKIQFEFHITKLGRINLMAQLIFNVRSYVGLNITNDFGRNYNTYDYIAPYSKEEIEEINNQLNETLNPNSTYLERDLLKKKLKKGTYTDEDVGIKIDFDIIDQEPKSFTEKDIEYWKKKLDFYEKREKDERKIIELRNELETMIYEKQNFLESNNVKELATDEEYSTLVKLIKETKDWFEEEGSYTRNISLLDSKIKLVNEEFSKINARAILKKERDLAFEKFLILIKNNQKQYLKEYKQSKPWTEFFYDDDYIPRIKQLNDTLTEKMEKQNKLKTYEEPIINKEEIENDTKEVENLYKKMINLPCPIHPHQRENIKLEDLFNFL